MTSHRLGERPRAAGAFVEYDRASHASWLPRAAPARTVAAAAAACASAPRQAGANAEGVTRRVRKPHRVGPAEDEQRASTPRSRSAANAAIAAGGVAVNIGIRADTPAAARGVVSPRLRAPRRRSRRPMAAAPQLARPSLRSRLTRWHGRRPRFDTDGSVSPAPQHVRVRLAASWHGDRPLLLLLMLVVSVRPAHDRSRRAPQSATMVRPRLRRGRLSGS